VYDESHLVVANIGSPNSVRNLTHSNKVCLSFIDIFVQKGFKVTGIAWNVGSKEASYAKWAAPLLRMADPRFPIHSVIVIQALGVEAIVAPSYRLYPHETSEQDQVASAMRTSGVSKAEGKA
jgi:hypothetical protein